MRPLLVLVASVLAAAAVAALGGSVAYAGAEKEPGIRLASGIGPVSLGTPRSILEQQLGGGRAGTDWYGSTIRFPRQHVHVSFLGRFASRVGTTWRGYRTAKGIGPGSTVARLRRAYPRATCDSAARPFDRTCTVPAPSGAAGPGLTLFYARGGVVREVDIWLVATE